MTRLSLPGAQMDSGTEIIAACDEIKSLLLEKNRAYGDSALAPLRIFSKADPVEQIRVRIDDKLSRLGRGTDCGEDVVLDLLGYLVLLRIAQKHQAEIRLQTLVMGLGAPRTEIPPPPQEAP